MRRIAILAAAIAVLSAAVATAAPSAPALQIAPANANGSVGAVITGAAWRITGTVSRYVAHQKVTIHVLRDGVRVLSRRLAIHRRGSEGVFATTVRIGGVGHLTVDAFHRASAGQKSMYARPFGLWLVAPQAQPGERSEAVRILQYQLAKAHYVIGAPGVYDAQTQWAVMAFRKMANLPREFTADASVFAALAAHAGQFVIRYPSQGRHIEADLTHQVIALIGANEVIQRIYAISSGKPSTPTELGNYRVYWKEPGTNNDGMVNSSFFNGGDAIHGYAEVPSYAASHGCLRVWIPDSLSIFDWVTVGTPVDVYYR